MLKNPNIRTKSEFLAALLINSERIFLYISHISHIYRNVSQTECEVNEKDAQKHTFLGNALQEKQPEIAMLLVCAGADFQTLQRYRKVKDVAPVHQAAMKGYKKLVYNNQSSPCM